MPAQLPVRPSARSPSTSGPPSLLSARHSTFLLARHRAPLCWPACLLVCCFLPVSLLLSETVQEMSWKHKTTNTMGIFLDYNDEKMQVARAEDAEAAIFSCTGRGTIFGDGSVSRRLQVRHIGAFSHMCSNWWTPIALECHLIRTPLQVGLWADLFRSSIVARNVPLAVCFCCSSLPIRFNQRTSIGNRR